MRFIAAGLAGMKLHNAQWGGGVGQGRMLLKRACHKGAKLRPRVPHPPLRQRHVNVLHAVHRTRARRPAGPLLASRAY